jgi:uncharacterized protein
MRSSAIGPFTMLNLSQVFLQRTASRGNLASPRQCLHKRPAGLLRCYSEAAIPAPPLLVKMRSDLKAAMKAKDTARLSVLRAVIASTLNASKTSSPVKTDSQMVALLKKHLTASKDAAVEFAKAGREDLVEKEQGQAAIMTQYVQESGLRQLSPEELDRIIIATQSEAAADGFEPKQLLNETTRRLMASNGPLETVDIEKKVVVERLRELLQ